MEEGDRSLNTFNRRCVDQLNPRCSEPLQFRIDVGNFKAEMMKALAFCFEEARHTARAVRWRNKLNLGVTGGEEGNPYLLRRDVGNLFKRQAEHLGMKLHCSIKIAHDRGDVMNATAHWEAVWREAVHSNLTRR